MDPFAVFQNCEESESESEIARVRERERERENVHGDMRNNMVIAFVGVNDATV